MNKEPAEKEKMMKQMLRYPLVAMFAAVMITACATPYKQLPGFDARQVDLNRYDTKVDHLVMVLDASNSMGEGYQGYQKLDIARGVIQNFNNTMPDVDIEVTLRSFGHADSVSTKSSDTLLAAQPYNRSGLAAAADRAQSAGGSSPLERSLKDVAGDFKSVDAPMALVIVSDGKDMASKPLSAAQALSADHPDQLCIYTVQVGDDADGEQLLGQIAATSPCGGAVNAADLYSGQSMHAFVSDVLFTAKGDSDGDGVMDDADRCPGTPGGVSVDRVGCPLDSDKDGVADHKDACPDTPMGAEVDAKGCVVPAPVPVATKSAQVTAAGTWLYKDIQFENNKADLRESSIPTLNEITEALKAQLDLKIEIQGHTDGSGTRAYNLGLSQRRAESVKAFLESQGIDAERMTTKGFGPDRPIDTNSTKEGRARNRRVEVKPMQ